MSRASRGWTGSSRIRTGSSRSSRISHNAMAEMVWHASNRHKAMAVRRERPARAAGSRAESRRPMEIKSEDAADDTMTAAQCRCGGNSRANVANGGWREGVLGVWPVLPSRLQQHGLRPLQESVKAPGGPPFPPLPWPRAVLPPRLNGAEEGVLPGGCPPTGVLPRPLDASPPLTRPLDAPRPPSLADTWHHGPAWSVPCSTRPCRFLGSVSRIPRSDPFLGSG